MARAVAWGTGIALLVAGAGAAFADPAPIDSTAARAAVLAGIRTTTVPVAPPPICCFLPADEPPREVPPILVPGVRDVPPPVLRAEVPYGGGTSPTGLAEDTILGPNRQPEWTTDRRWTRVRSYVIAPGQVEFESWYRGRFPRHGGNDRHIFQEEVSVGLPGRFQIDLYGNFEHDDQEDFHFVETQFEVRWALAAWDCVPLNPTLYFEYKRKDDRDESDVVEAKLLLSDDLGCRWKWGANLVYEREVKGEEEEVFGFTLGASYTVIDQRLAVGAEFQYERATVAGARDEPEHTYYLGPSIHIRTGRRTHLDIAPLFGLNDDSQRMQVFVVLGIDLSPRGADGGWLNPVSARSR